MYTIIDAEQTKDKITLEKKKGKRKSSGDKQKKKKSKRQKVEKASTLEQSYPDCGSETR